MFYKSLNVVLKEKHTGICSGRMVPMAKLSAARSAPSWAISLLNDLIGKSLETFQC